MRSQIVHPKLLDTIAGSQGLQFTYVTIKGSSQSQRTAGRGFMPGYSEADKRVPCWISSPAYRSQQSLIAKFGDQVAARISLVAMFAPGTRIVEGQTIVNKNEQYQVLKVANSVTAESPLSVALGNVRTIPKV